MIKLTESLRQFLTKFYPQILPLIILGHVEMITEEIENEYIEWCKTEEGRSYLKGGANYKEPS